MKTAIILLYTLFLSSAFADSSEVETGDTQNFPVIGLNCDETVQGLDFKNSIFLDESDNDDQIILFTKSKNPGNEIRVEITIEKKSVKNILDNQLAKMVAVTLAQDDVTISFTDRGSDVYGNTRLRAHIETENGFFNLDNCVAKRSTKAVLN